MIVAHLSFLPMPPGEDPAELVRRWQLLEILEPLARCGAETTYYAPGPEFELTRGNVCVRFIPERGRHRMLSRGVFPPRTLVEAALATHPDVFHVHGLHHAAQLLYLHRTCPQVPVFVQDHANRPPEGLLRRMLHRYALSTVAAVSFTDLELAQPHFDSGTLSVGANLHEIQEGSTRFLPGDRDHARASTGLTGFPCCLWVGDLNANKDPLVALEGFRRARAELPRAELWMCFRQSPLLRDVERYLAARRELAGAVHLLGARDHAAMECLHRAADFYLSSSRREGGAYSAVEALACGATPIVTNTPVFRRITDHGRYGGLFDPGDAGALGQRLIEWTPRLCEALRVRARERFDAALSPEVIAGKLVGLYESIKLDPDRDRPGRVEL